MNKDQHQSYRHHLQLIVIILLGILALPTKQSNTTQSLRPFHTERRLESPETLSCSHNDNFCIVQRQIAKPETVYSFSIKPKTNFGLYLTSDNNQDLRLAIEVEPFENLSIFLHSYEGSLSHEKRFYKFLYPKQKWTEVIVPGPVEDIQVYFVNELSTSRRVVTVTASWSETSETSNWAIPVGASVGGVIIILIVTWACYKRRRLNRQNRQGRNAEAVAEQYQVVELGSPPPSPRQARQEANHNRRQQPQAQRKPLPKPLPKPSIQEIIDICYPEANFAQFESSFSQKTCTICLDDMQENRPCRQLDCQHVFHSKCGKQWLESQYKKQKKVFCPNCNKRVRFDVKKAAKKKQPVEAAKK